MSRIASAAVAMLICAAALHAADQPISFSQDADLGQWQITGNAKIDTAKDRADSGGSLCVAPGAQAIMKLRDADGAGKVTMWVYEDGTAPADPKVRRAGPMWGLINAEGRIIGVGELYAPYLSGDKSYAVGEYTPAKKEMPFFKVSHLGLNRAKGWHEWTFNFDANKGLAILYDGKDVNDKRQRFDWNKSDVAGFAGVVVVGDTGKGDAGQTIWVDDVTVALGGEMAASPTPPPPPPPAVPDADPAPDGPVPQFNKALLNQHPRLLFTAQDIPRIKAFAASDLAKPIMGAFTGYLAASGPPDSKKFLTDATDGQRQGYWRMPTLAVNYAMNRDKASLDKGIACMKFLLDMPNWETGSELDSGMSAANIMVGAALLYDVMYNDLDPAFREQFRKKLLLHARKMCHGGHLNKNNANGYWQGDPSNNHRWHRNAGMTLCILAAYTGAPEEQWILEKTKEDLDYVNKWLPEDGTSHEGPTYMIFGASHLVIAMDAADRCLGTHYLQNPFYKAVGKFMTQSLLPNETDLFNFGDSGGGRLQGYAQFLYRTAAVNKQADVQAAMDAAWKAAPNKSNVAAWMALIWCDPSLSGQPLSQRPTRAMFDDLGLAYIRDQWGDDGVAAMFKCGPFGGYTLNRFRNENNFKYINVAHDDPDANSFTLWKNGALIAETDAYAKHKQSSNHNTVLINGMGQMASGRPEGGTWSQPATGNVDMTKMAYLTAWKDSPQTVIVEGEAAGSYLKAADKKTKASRPALDRYRRTFIWVQGDYVLVLDDIRAPKDVDVAWLMQAKDMTIVGKADGRFNMASDKASCDFRVVTDQSVFPSEKIVTSTANGKQGELGWKQLQLTASTKAIRLASAYDLWNKGITDVKMTTDGDKATVQVIGKGFSDTWTWQAAPDANTASTVSGARNGKAIGGITATDTIARP